MKLDQLALRIIETVKTHRVLGTTEIRDFLGLPATSQTTNTLHKRLQRLANAGYLEKGEAAYMRNTLGHLAVVVKWQATNKSSDQPVIERPEPDDLPWPKFNADEIVAQGVKNSPRSIFDWRP